MRFKRTVRIGTRKSKLALAQAQLVREALRAAYPDGHFELVPMSTAGDRFYDVQVTSIEGKGIFLKELEDALLNREIDCAVHSMKDVPTELLPELTIGVILKREDPHDALIARCSIAELPSGSSIGTGSSRRAYQLLSFRSDLQIKAMRGNVDTRIRKWQEGHYDALVLAVAGLKRMGLEHVVSQILPFDIMLPPAGQGAIGIEMRTEDRSMLETLSFLNDWETHISVSAERAFLEAAGGGCRLPIGVYGEVQGKQIHLSGRIVREATRAVVEGKLSGGIEEAMLIGKRLAEQIAISK